MSTHTIAEAFRQHLASFGISATLGDQVPYGHKLVVTNAAIPTLTRTLVIYDGKKGPRIVFEGSAWSEELQTGVRTLWQRFRKTPMEPHEDVSAHDDGHVVMYVDGSYQEANGTPCISWAFEVWQHGRSLHAASGVISDEHLLSLRNVAGECEAGRQGLQWAHSKGYRAIEVRYDYMGLAAWPRRSWKAKLPFTQQYAQDIQEIAKHLSISWKHVHGHSGEVGNERVDRMAREAIGHGAA